MTDYEFYDDLPLEEPLLDALASQGCGEMHPDQAEFLHHLLAGRDLLAASGDDETSLALAITALDRVDPADDRIQVLLFTATNEETNRLAGIMAPLSQDLGLDALSILEGESLRRDFQGLKKKPAIIIGTLDLVMEHIDRGTLEVADVQLVIFDRIDAMDDLGMTTAAEKLLGMFPPDGPVQKVLTVTALSDEIRRLSWRCQGRPKHHFPGKQNVDGYRHEYYPVLDTTRFNTLCAWLDMELKEGAPRGVVVFTRTLAQTQDVAYSLNLNGFEAEVINGRLPRQEQDSIIHAIRDGHSPLLITNDQGFQDMVLEDFSHVIHYNITDRAESFADRLKYVKDMRFDGKTISFITSHEHATLVKSGSLAGENVEYGEYDLDDYLGDYHFKQDHEKRSGNRNSGRRESSRHRPEQPPRSRDNAPRSRQERGNYNDDDSRRQGHNRGGYDRDGDDGYMKFRTSHGGRKFTYRYRFVG